MPNDLILAPDYVFLEKPRFSTIVSEFENGSEQRRARWSQAIYQWRLVFKNRTSTDRDTISTLFNSKKGRLTSFTWTHPKTAATYTVRFVDDEIEFSEITYNLYDFEFSLQQVV